MYPLTLPVQRQIEYNRTAVRSWAQTEKGSDRKNLGQTCLCRTSTNRPQQPVTKCVQISSKNATVGIANNADGQRRVQNMSFVLPLEKYLVPLTENNFCQNKYTERVGERRGCIQIYWKSSTRHTQALRNWGFALHPSKMHLRYPSSSRNTGLPAFQLTWLKRD